MCLFASVAALAQVAVVALWPEASPFRVPCGYQPVLCCCCPPLSRHMRGIVHRDLKSPNLLVDATWRCKVAGKSVPGSDLGLDM